MEDLLEKSRRTGEIRFFCILPTKTLRTGGKVPNKTGQHFMIVIE
jgi:hypothetical protein